MFDRKELKEVAQMHVESPCFVSLYLNVNPLTNAKGDYIIQFKNMVKKTTDSLPRDVYKCTKGDFEKMESFVLANKRQFRKGLVLLSSSESGFWKEYHLPVPVKSELVVDRSPYIKPLLDLLDAYQRYIVLLVDKESARIMALHLGEIVEYGEVHTPDVPGKHKKGGWFALSQNHYDRHIEYHVNLHLKDVIKKLDGFLAGENIGGIILGGSDEALTMVREMLPAAVSAKIVGAFHGGMLAKTDEILAKVEAVVHSHEKQKKDAIVERLITQAKKNEQAVLGMENVLNALGAGSVMELVFASGYNADGYICKACRSVSVQDSSGCPYCRSELERTGYAVDAAAQKAVEQGAGVVVIRENEKFAQAGGIGAFLRF